MQECARCSNTHLWASAGSRPGYMLPMDVVPFDRPGEPGYRIELSPVIAADEPYFDGQVTIAINILNAVKEFPINSADLELQHVLVMDGTLQNPIWQHPTLREDKENERVWLCFGQELATGRGTISIKYRGKFNRQLRSFYISHDRDANGNVSPIACTESEPADFRRWVPSFDQPGPECYKSSFEMTAVVAANLTVRSNTPIVSETMLSGRNQKRVCFAPTNKLPTYVVALVVGKLESSDPITVSGVEVRVWAAEGSKHLMGFALEVVSRTLPLLEDFHGVKYPNKKLDLIGVQEFAFGAMEDDGMFIFRRDLLLIDKSTATVAALIKAATTIVHEMDHTWDGNRITMLEWSQLPLNELRATFMSFLILDVIYPHWNIWTRFAQMRAEAMEVDGLRNTRAIVSPIDRLEQLTAIFDVITYRKGAAVLRQGQVTLDTTSRGGFRAGMRHFNALYAWGNASTEQLWDAIGEKSGIDFRGFMDTWMLQTGFPSVMVTRANWSAITVTQSPFQYLNETLSGGQQYDNQPLWQIPLHIRVYAGGTVYEQVLQLNSREQTFDLGVDFDWLVVNAGGHGFYRVRYGDSAGSDNLLDEVTTRLHTHLTAVERFNVLNDAWAYLQAGSISLDSYLNLVENYKHEDDPSVWRIIAASLSGLSQFAPPGARPQFAKFVEDLTQSMFAQLGWHASVDEPEQLSEVRGIIIGLLGSQRLEWLVEQSLQYAYEPWLLRQGVVNADVLAAAVKAVARSGNRQTYSGFLMHLSEGLAPQQETMFQEALCCFSDGYMADKTLSMILSGEIKVEMGGILVKQLMQNPAVRDLAWCFVKENFAELHHKFPPNLLIRALEGVRWLDKPEDSQDVGDFFAANANLLTGNEKPIAQTMEWQRINSAFRQRCVPQLDTCLAGGMGLPVRKGGE